LQRFGVTKLNLGRLPLLSALAKAPLDVVPTGTSSAAHARA
jgi:hypothetical protein